MKRLTQTFPLILAMLLHVMPLLRNIVTIPAASSSFAIIIRWTIGSTAALGAYDACSGSSTAYFMPTQTNIVLTQGVYFTNSVPYSITVTNTGSDTGAYFDVTNAVTKANTGQLGNLQSSTKAVPAGLTVKCYEKSSSHYVYLAIYGSPTTVTAKTRINVEGGYSGAPSVYTNIYITVVAASSTPIITNQPVDATIVAGGTTNFTLLAGTAPLYYQWYFNTNTSLTDATNALLNLANIRASQAGTYSVVITNSAGAITSSPAVLNVSLPPSPVIQSLGTIDGVFQFTFNPVVGLTNSVVTNNTVNGASWVVMTNVPPPTTTNAVTVSDTLNDTNRFYRVQIIP